MNLRRLSPILVFTMVVGCQGKSGRTTSRADLERYLLRFPQGWRSEAVRRALAQ